MSSFPQRVQTACRVARVRPIRDGRGANEQGLRGAPFHLDTQEVGPGWSAVVKKMIKAGSAEAVNGIGAEAAFMKDAGGSIGLVTRKGSCIVSVTMDDD